MVTGGARRSGGAHTRTDEVVRQPVSSRPSQARAATSFRGWLLSGLLVVLALNGCATSIPRRTAAPFDTPPMSSDAPLEFGVPTRSPSEGVESVLGMPAFVVDTIDRSLYEFDFDRRRFLGPTLLMRGTKPRVLPGFPFLIDSSAAQQATRLGEDLFVAGGPSGTVLVFKFDRNHPVANGEIRLASAIAAATPGASPGSNHVQVTNRDRFIHSFGVLPNGNLLVLAKDLVDRSTWAYSVSLSDFSMMLSKQLGNGYPVGSASVGGRTYVAFDAGHVDEIDSELHVVRRMTLPQPARYMTAWNGRLLVSAAVPAALFAVDPSDAQVELLDSVAPEAFGGPVFVVDGHLWWALSSGDQLRDATDPSHAQLKICRGAQAGAAVDGQLLITCVGDEAVAFVDLRSRQSWFDRSFRFPVSVAP